MDLNLLFWKSEGKTFSQRFHHWADILDPTLLFKSSKEIEESRTLLQDAEHSITESLQDKTIREAWMLSLASVHPVTGDIIPAAFRPPAFLPFAAPLVVAALLPHRGAKQAFLWQFAFHSYVGGFNLANGNAVKEASGNAAKQAHELPYKQLLLCTGAVTYSACLGALPQYFMTRYKLQSPSMQLLFKKIIPGPLTALMCAFNVLVTRSTEFEKGIQVMDSQGKVIGISQRAGEKAVKEVALSRAALFGTAVFLPDLVLHCLHRTSILLRNPLALIPLRSILMISVFGMMIPVSFSWEPQLAKIKRSQLEPEIVPLTEETELFYNRGV